MVKEYNADYRFKVCIIGAAGSGKTAMVDQLVNHEFHEETKTTVGVEYATLAFNVNDYTVQLEMWDTAGQEKYHSIAKTYFRNAKACVLVFDISEQKSFDELTLWLDMFRQLADPNAYIILVGNKADLEEQRQVQGTQAQEFAKENLLEYIETSSVTGQNIKETFEKIARILFDYAKEGKMETGPAIKKQQVHQTDYDSGCKC